MGPRSSQFRPILAVCIYTGTRRFDERGDVCAGQGFLLLALHHEVCRDLRRQHRHGGRRLSGGASRRLFALAVAGAGADTGCHPGRSEPERDGVQDAARPAAPAGYARFRRRRGAAPCGGAGRRCCRQAAGADDSKCHPGGAFPQAGDGRHQRGRNQAQRGRVGRGSGARRARESRRQSAGTIRRGGGGGPPAIAAVAVAPPAADPAPQPVQQAPVEPEPLPPVEIKSRPVAAVEASPLPEPAPPAHEEDKGILSTLKKIPEMLRPASGAVSADPPRPPLPVGQ